MSKRDSENFCKTDTNMSWFGKSFFVIRPFDEPFSFSLILLCKIWKKKLIDKSNSIVWKHFLVKLKLLKSQKRNLKDLGFS